MAQFRNYAIQIGYLGSDPESRQVGDDKVVTMDVATTKRWKDSEGQQQERTFWRRYEAWNKMGENMLSRLKKGSRVQIASEPSNNNYEKDGVTHYTERHTVMEWLALDDKENDQE